MHEKKFCTLPDGAFHSLRPLLPRNLRVGPEWLNCRHERTMLHFSLWKVAVPPTIFQLLFRQPANRLLDTRVLLVSERDKSPNHVPSQARLVPPLPRFFDYARACERPALSLVKIKESLTFSLDLGIRGNSHLTEEDERPNGRRPFRTIAGLFRSPIAAASLRLHDSLDRPVVSNSSSGRHDIFVAGRPIEKVDECLKPDGRVPWL